MKYYLPSEVILHNKPDDAWVSLLGKVFDVTNVLKENKDEGMADGLIASAGKDISHWFDKKTKNLKQYIHPITGLKMEYTPKGFVPQKAVTGPSDQWMPSTIVNRSDEGPWWKNKRYLVGYLTKRARPLRIVNTLAPPPFVNSMIWVASEEKLKDIIERISNNNSHIGSYTVKHGDKILDLEKTLAQNGIPDERDHFTQLGLPDDHYIPSITLYYNDDLTEE